MPTLSIDIEARFARFQDGLDKIDRDVSRATRGMSQSFGTLKTVAAGLIGTFAGLATIGGIKSVINDLDKLNTVSERSGISANALSGLAFVAKQTGTDLDVLAKGVNKLSIGMSEISTGGNDKLKKLFEGLGLADLAKGAATGEEALTRLAEVFPRLSDIDQARVAAEAFGEKIGSQLVPALSAGRKELEGMIKEGKELFPVTNELAKAADDFNDSMGKLSLVLKSSLLPLLEVILPLLTGISEGFVNAKRAGLGFIGSLDAMFRGSLSTNYGDQIKSLTKQIEDAEKVAKSAQTSFLGIKTGPAEVVDIEKLKKMREFFKAQQRDDALALGKGVQSNEGRLSLPGQIKLADEPAKKVKKAKVDRDDSAQRLLDQQIKAFERSVAEERDIAASRNDFLQRFYDDGLISLGDYTKGRIAIMEESAQKQKTAINSEIALLEASKKGKAADDRISIDSKINDLLDKQADLNRDVAISGQNLFLDNAREARAFADELQRVNIELLKSKGDIEGAARLQFSLDNRDLNARIDTAAKSGATPEERAAAALAKERNNELRDRNIEMASFNVLANETNRIRNDAADAEERIQIAIKSGSTGEIQGLQQINALRINTSTLLTEQAQKMQNIATLTQDQSQIDSVKALGMEIERLNSQLDPLREKFDDMATRGLSGFFEKVASGTVSAKDAFRSMIADWTAEITRFMVRAAVQKLIAGFASSMAGGAGGGSSAGIASSLYAEGGQVSGPGSGTSDSIPVLLSNKEFVVRAKPTQEPGAVAFLTRFNRLGMKSLQRYSMGGLVGAGISSGGLAMAGGGVNLTQNFTVEARTPKETQQQLASSAYQGGMRAFRRNR